MSPKGPFVTGLVPNLVLVDVIETLKVGASWEVSLATQHVPSKGSVGCPSLSLSLPS